QQIQKLWVSENAEQDQCTSKSRQTWHVYNWRCKYGINRTHVVIRYSPAGKRRQYWPET
ncbi:hypothetical protein ABHI18_009553, partial [Aspergillus niger]